MVRLAGEADCSRATRALLLAGKLSVGEVEFPVVPGGAWRAPSLLPVGVVPGEEAHRASHATAASKAAAASRSL
eukprot:9212673-Alexandrium_andersonii.AAC.1